MSDAPMHQEMVNFFERQPHVKQAIGVVSLPIEGITMGAAGVDLKAFDVMSGGFTFVEGQAFQQPNDVIIDTFYNAQQHKHAGDSINLMGHEWRICGITASGKLAHIVFPLKVLQESSGNSNHVSQIYLKLDDPHNTESVVTY